MRSALRAVAAVFGLANVLAVNTQVQAETPRIDVTPGINDVMIFAEAFTPEDSQLRVGELPEWICSAQPEVRGAGWTLRLDVCGEATAPYELEVAVVDVLTGEGIGGLITLRGTSPRLRSVVPVRAAPNPFNPVTIITYSVPESLDGREVSLTVYNALGQKIRVLVDEQQIAGEYSVKWDGKTDEGRPVSAGAYLYRLSVGQVEATQKLTFLE